MPIRRGLDLRAFAIMLTLCMVWGFQQVAMKFVAPAAPPVMQLAIRFSCAAAFFGVWVLAREGIGGFVDGTLPSGLLLGLTFSLEFMFAGQALVHTSAAHTVVFLYTAPLFTALGLQYLPDERLSAAQWIGIGMAFAGVAVAFLGSAGRTAGAPIRGDLLGDLLALAGGASWGISTVVLRRGRVGNAATAKTVFYQVSFAALLLFGFAALTGQWSVRWTPVTIASVAFQTVFIAIASYLVWFWLLRRYLNSRLMLLSLLTPLFGVAFGVALLGDALELRFAVGTLLVLCGVLLVNVLPSLRPRSRRRNAI
jgi:drug/metabolite transporter (DMT)-like permease